MTDVELDERVAALEENAGGNVQNGSYMQGENNIFISHGFQQLYSFYVYPRKSYDNIMANISKKMNIAINCLSH